MSDKKKSGGKRKKFRIILASVIAAVVVALFILQIPQLLIAMSTMKPLDTQEVLPNVYAIRDTFVNMYLYKSGDGYIAFDAGTNANTVSSALDSLGISKMDVTAVFLTHTDADHVMALTLFPGAEVIMAASNSAFLETKDGQDRSGAFIDMGRGYNTLGNGASYTTDAGVEIKAYYTPGHTPGSACYLVDEKYLFTGDNFRLSSGKADLFYSVFNMDNETQRESIIFLSGIDYSIEAVFTMHNGYTTDFDAAFKKWQ